MRVSVFTQGQGTGREPIGTLPRLHLLGMQGGALIGMTKRLGHIISVRQAIVTFEVYGSWWLPECRAYRAGMRAVVRPGSGCVDFFSWASCIAGSMLFGELSGCCMQPWGA